LPAPLIVGLGEAARLAHAEMGDDTARIAALRIRLLGALQDGIPAIRVNGSTSERIAGSLNVTFPDTTAADLMARCPELCVSTGSACSSAEIEPSYVLRAMGLDTAAAARTLRIGIGRFTSAAEIDYAGAALIAAQSPARERKDHAVCRP
jgi:cysteine desulfurase